MKRDAANMRMLQDASQEVFDDPLLNFGNSDEGPIDGLPYSPPALARRVRDLSAFDQLRGKDYFADDAFARYTDAYELAARAVDPISGAPNAEAADDEVDAAHLLADTPDWKMVRDCLGEDYEFGPFALATIDIQAPDEDLIADFRLWLELARKNRGVDPLPRAVTKDDLDLWSEMQVLAYIDLTIWAYARNLKIGATVMGRALFPMEFDIGLEDRVRKVIAREARKLTNMDVLRSMQSQHVKAERESENSTPES